MVAHDLMIERPNHHGLMFLVGLHFEQMLEEDLAVTCKKSRVRLCPPGASDSFNSDLLVFVLQ